LYRRILLARESWERRPRSQDMERSLRSRCWRLDWICFRQVSCRSRYLVSDFIGTGVVCRNTGGQVTGRVVKVIITNWNYSGDILTDYEGTCPFPRSRPKLNGPVARQDDAEAHVNVSTTPRKVPLYRTISLISRPKPRLVFALNEMVVGIHMRLGNTQTVDKPQQRIWRYTGACITTAFVIGQNYSIGGNGAIRTPGDLYFLHCIWRRFMSACLTKWVYRFVVYACKCISLANNQIVNAV